MGFRNRTRNFLHMMLMNTWQRIVKTNSRKLFDSSHFFNILSKIRLVIL